MLQDYGAEEVELIWEPGDQKPPLDAKPQIHVQAMGESFQETKARVTARWLLAVAFVVLLIGAVRLA
jgi:hypothetical protein